MSNAFLFLANPPPYAIRNLRDIVQAGRQGGAKIVLNTASVNLRDCPPFGSLVNSNLPVAERAQFDSLYSSVLSPTKPPT